MKKDAGLVGGIGLAAVAWVVLVTVLILQHRPIPWFSLAYNIPITLLFAGLVLHLVWVGIRLGWTRFVTAFAPLGVVWVVGVRVSFLTLNFKLLIHFKALEKFKSFVKVCPALTIALLRTSNF